MKPGSYGIIGLAPLLLILGCKNPTLAAFEKAAAELPAAEAEAKRLGLPLAGTDLAPAKPIPPEQNANYHLSLAMNAHRQLLEADSNLNAKVVYGIISPSQQNTPAAASAVESLSTALDLAVTASKKPDIRFRRDWKSTRPWGMMFPERDALRAVTRSLVVRAQYFAYKGNTSRSIQDFQAAMALAKFAGSEPSLLSGLLQGAIEGSIISGMESALALRPQDEEYWTALDNIVAEQAESPLDWNHHLGMEVWSLVASASVPMQNMRQSLKEMEAEGLADKDDLNVRTAKRVMQPGVPDPLLESAYRARALQIWVEYFRQDRSQQSVIDAAVDLSTIIHNYSLDDDPTMVNNQELFDDVVPQGEAFARREVRLQLFRSLVAVLKYRKANGHFPQSLKDAGLEPHDPFAGGPVKLLIGDGRVIVYSVGRDRLDDQGVERTEMRVGDDFRRDVSAIFPRPLRVPPRGQQPDVAI